MSAGTLSRICMLCNARVICPWEADIDETARTAGWMTLPANERRKDPEMVCAECWAEVGSLHEEQARAKLATALVEAPERRLRLCVERWPECYTMGYDPRCCRFPRSCSCTVYDLGRNAKEEDLEPSPAGRS